MNPEWIGYIAAVLTTAAYVPQTIKIAKTRQTQGISLGMYLLLNCGIAGWFVYGYLLSSPSLMLANGLSLLMTLFILFIKIKHK